MLEADDVSNPVTSPILGSSGLRKAVAAAQARVVTDLGADEPSEQHAEEHSELGQPPDTPVERVRTVPAEGQSSERQTTEAALVSVPSGCEGDASAISMEDCTSSCGGTSAANDQPRTGQALMDQSAHPGLEVTVALAAHSQDNNPAGMRSAPLKERPCALSIEVDTSGNSTQPESASTAPAQHSGATPLPFHSLASPNRLLEGLQSPELQASMSPASPAGIALQPTAGPSPPGRPVAVDGPSMQKVSDGCLSPAATEPEDGLTPASQAEAAPRETAPEQALAHTGVNAAPPMTDARVQELRTTAYCG